MLKPTVMEGASEIGGTDSRLWFATALIADRWEENVRLAIRDGRIATLEVGVACAPPDERCAVAIPGLPNVHSHAFQRGMAGLAETRGPTDDTFWTWRELMYQFLDRLDPADIEAITAQAYLEMLEGGFTRVGEFHYLHHDETGTPYTNIAETTERIASAATATGIQLTLLPSFYAHANFGGFDPLPGQRRFITNLDQFAAILDSAERIAQTLPGTNVGVAPHSLRAVTPAELNEVVKLANARPIHIHAAEQIREVEACLTATGLRPVEWLLSNQSLNSNWCLIHATHVTPDESAGLAQTGATVGLCPITEANLGDGIFPGVQWLTNGGVFAIGTDANTQLDAAAELRALEYSQRLSQRARNLLAGGDDARSTARAIFDAAMRGGQRALGVGMSGIALGAPADLVELCTDYDTLTARERGDTLLGRHVFGGGGGVDRVWVRGRCQVRNGRHVAREQIQSRFRRTLRKLLVS